MYEELAFNWWTRLSVESKMALAMNLYGRNFKEIDAYQIVELYKFADTHGGL